MAGKNVSLTVTAAAAEDGSFVEDDDGVVWKGNSLNIVKH